MNYLLLILTIIALFLVFRNINLWYFRINEIISNQQETNRLLRKIAGESENMVETKMHISDNLNEQKTDTEKIEDFNKRLYN